MRGQKGVGCVWLRVTHLALFLAGSLGSIFEDQQLAVSLSRSAREAMLKQHSEEDIKEKTMSIYRDILENHS